MGLKSFVVDMLKELGPELLAEFIGFKSLKRVLSKGKDQVETSLKEQRIPDIKFGGVFDLSDETAYFGILGKLESDPDWKKENHPAKVSKFLNSLEHNWQKRKFRASVGILANVEYTKEIRKGSETIPRQKGEPIKKEHSVEIKTNMGIEFMKSFARHSEPEMKEICQAAGILDPSFGQKLRSYFDENQDEILEKIKKRRTDIPLKDEVYRGFFKEMFGFFKKNPVKKLEGNK
jgi:hypothetical protein